MGARKRRRWKGREKRSGILRGRSSLRKLPPEVRMGPPISLFLFDEEDGAAVRGGGMGGGEAGGSAPGDSDTKRFHTFV